MLDPSTLQALPLGDYLEYLALTLALGLVGTFEVFRNLIRARIIEDTPTSKIRSAAQGYVELIGRCEPYDGNVLSAPLTGTACLWHRYAIERYELSRNGGRWRKVEDGTSSEWFQINDDTGTCAVDPAGADVTSRTKEVWYGNTRHPLSGERGGLGLLGASYRYTEERLHDGDSTYVLGDFRTVRTNPRAHAQRMKSQWLAELKQDRHRLLEAYDTNRNGEVDLREWEAARQSAERAVEREIALQSAQPPISCIGKTRNRRRPFLISCHPQRRLARRYRVRAAVATLFAVPGCSIGIWLLLGRYLIA